MMKIPDLTIQYENSQKIPPSWNLRRFLFVGGADINARWGLKKIEAGELSVPKLDRLGLLNSFKEQFETELISGASIISINTRLSNVKIFYQFIDRNQLPATQESVVDNYLEWAEYLFAESHIKSPRINISTAYGYAASLSSVLGKILEIPDAERLINRTRLHPPRTRKKALPKSAEKQNLEETFKFGNFLTDLIVGLTIETIYGKWPIKISIKKGLVDNDEVVIHSVFKESTTKWLVTDRAHTRNIKSATSLCYCKIASRWILLMVHQDGLL